MEVIRAAPRHAALENLGRPRKSPRAGRIAMPDCHVGLRAPFH